MLTSLPVSASLPYKSVAAALLFSVIFGPIGLLYASFWGGILMILIAIFLICNKLWSLTLLAWVVSCVWGVGAVESYNKKIIRHSLAAQGSVSQ